MNDVQNFVGGVWRTPNETGWGDIFNPSRGEVIARIPLSDAAEVDYAVQAAKKAFATWSRMPATKRARFLFAYRGLLEEHFAELVQIVTCENGKTVDEAKGDVRRGIEVVDFACGIAHLQKGESLHQVADQMDAVTMREPIGVCGGITPFNFPAMVPMWMYPLAIACGNTFVLKPSEKVPMTANRLAELFAEAGLPEGVFNVVHGGKEVVDALCTHPDVVAVSFVGSSVVAKHVYSLACSHGKRVQAAGGAKNALLVMPDAEPAPTLRAILGSAYGCAGQRCMAGSVLMAVGQAADEWRDRVGGAVAALKVDDTSHNASAEMGPVIDERSRVRISRLVDDALGSGANIAAQGSAGPGHGFFVAPTLIDNVRPEMQAFRSEIFGPVLSMVRVATLDEAISNMNRLNYGNGATIFSSSGASARQFTEEMQCGMLGINVGVPAPPSLFAFSGWNDSFYGDLHVQGMEGILFYTRQRIVLSRWDRSYVRAQGW